MKKLIPLSVIVLFFSISAFSQVDSLATEQVDSLSTEQVAVQDTVTDNSQNKKERKKVNVLTLYGGVSYSSILLSNSSFESAYATGYLLGLSYRKGRFSYWEIGLNYNNSVVSLEDLNILEDNMHIRQIEVPLSAGINLLSVTRKVIGLRLFGGVAPGYILNVSDNPFDLDKDNLNRFQFGGRVGLGVDALFLSLELGYQYGFIDVLKNQSSKLSQLDLRLGFRF